MQFKADEEKQQDNADFGNRQLRFRSAYKAKTLRADQRTGNQIAQYRTKAETAKQHDEQHRRPQQDYAFGQQEVGCVKGRVRRRSRGSRHQASAARAASATASKLSRMEA